MTSGTKE
jgi:hypothetical protein